MPRVRAFALDASEQADPLAQADVLERVRELHRYTLKLQGVPAEEAEATACVFPQGWIQDLHADPMRVAILRARQAAISVAERQKALKHFQAQVRRLRRAVALDPSRSTKQKLRQAELVLAGVDTWLRCGPDPKRIALERRKKSSADTHHLNRSIGPEASIEAIRHWYVPLVVRRVHAFMRCLLPGLRHQGRQVGLVERAEMDRFVSGSLHVLVADFVRAYYPIWASDLTAARVGTTLRNMRRREKA